MTTRAERAARRTERLAAMESAEPVEAASVDLTKSPKAGAKSGANGRSVPEPVDPKTLARPAMVDYVAYALWAAAALAILTGAAYYAFRSQYTDLVVDYARDHNNDVPTHGDVSKFILIQLLTQVFLGAVLVYLGYRVRQGWHLVRIAVTAIWLMTSTIFPGFMGIGGIFGVASTLPVGIRVLGLLAALSMLAAVIMSNLPRASNYFRAHKPAPPAGGVAPRRGGLFGSPAGGAAPRGSLFAPRPRPDAAPAPKPSRPGVKPKSSAPVDVDAPARPAGKAGNRSKSRARSE